MIRFFHLNHLLVTMLEAFFTVLREKDSPLDRRPKRAYRRRKDSDSANITPHVTQPSRPWAMGFTNLPVATRRLFTSESVRIYFQISAVCVLISILLKGHSCEKSGSVVGSTFILLSGSPNAPFASISSNISSHSRFIIWTLQIRPLCTRPFQPVPTHTLFREHFLIPSNNTSRTAEFFFAPSFSLAMYYLAGMERSMNFFKNKVLWYPRWCWPLFACV